MALRMVCRFECDAPGCREAFVSTHTDTTKARDHLFSWGWTMLRWRFPGAVSSSRKLYLCQRFHANWRPAKGMLIGLTRRLECTTPERKTS